MRSAFEKFGKTMPEIIDLDKIDKLWIKDTVDLILLLRFFKYKNFKKMLPVYG